MSKDNRWIQTYTGKQFWPLSPRWEDVDLLDIAHALAMKCRFTGHCDQFYSVAQHSVLVSQNVPFAQAKQALLHDAGEAYLPDVSRPIKGSLRGFAELEDEVLLAVGRRFNLDNLMTKEIKDADNLLLVTEARDVMGKPPIPWDFPAIKPLPTVIKPLPPKQAKDLFLRRAKEIGLTD